MITCRSCRRRATPKRDEAGLWWCRGCAEPLDCDECGKQLPHQHEESAEAVAVRASIERARRIVADPDEHPMRKVEAELMLRRLGLTEDALENRAKAEAAETPAAPDQCDDRTVGDPADAEEQSCDGCDEGVQFLSSRGLCDGCEEEIEHSAHEAAARNPRCPYYNGQMVHVAGRTFRIDGFVADMPFFTGDEPERPLWPTRIYTTVAGEIVDLPLPKSS